MPYPELVIDYHKLETKFFDNDVQHTTFHSDASQGKCQVKVVKTWRRAWELGRGSSGTVHLERSDTGEYRAVKDIAKETNSRIKINYERELMAMAVLAKAEVKEPQFIFRPWLTTLQHDALFVQLFGWPPPPYLEVERSESEAKVIIRQLLEGLVVIHQEGFAHRDLKPENIFMVSESPIWVKIGDFGLAKLARTGTAFRTNGGTMSYVAPEVEIDPSRDTSEYTNAVDIWSIGCITHELLTQVLPFRGIRALVSYCSCLEFPRNSMLSKNISQKGIEFVESTLAYPPERRIAAKEALGSEWLRPGYGGEAGRKSGEGTTTIRSMESESCSRECLTCKLGNAEPASSNPLTPAIMSVKYEPQDDEGIEEVVRQPEWMRSPPPANPSSSSEASNCSHNVSATDIFRRPAVAATSQEMLVLHFDKSTCGILSVKDGIYENPWRTYVWPLGGDSPALYHAILSMTAFHMCIHRPELRFSGMEHMRLSLGYLARGFRDGDIQTDAALATTLVLAFAEAFDTHITTGIQHLRGAKALVSQAFLTMRRSPPPDSAAVKRFRFLYNVWVYLDVLARLTSDDDDGGHASGIPLTHGPLSSTSEIDPLLGCSATLFPLIGRVAALAQRVRKTTRNSEALIAQAAEVKSHIAAWTPEASYESPDDPTSSVDNCVNAAEAYRWATLLYLHQVVPELPSPPAQQLAGVVIRLLAAVPISSRSCIVHIYPLLVAGCEAVTPEDRAWVKARWQAMSDRLWVGNVRKAWEVVAEVWDRRDRFIALHPGREFGELATIRGRLHWLGVMREWNWEVLLT